MNHANLILNVHATCPTLHSMSSTRTRNRLPPLLIVASTLVFIQCDLLVGSENAQDEDFPWISTLDSGNWRDASWGDRELRQNGSRLLKLEKGIHFLEPELNPKNDVLIAIHGFAARGYEWVYPLQVLDNDELDTYFFRWDWGKPTEKAEQLFLSEFEEIHSKRRATLKKVRVVAHSCGGTVIMSVLESLSTDLDFEIHVVASPLGGLGIFTVCDVDLPKEIPDNFEVTQWKTQQHMDSVFLYFPWDTQDAGLDGIKVIDLPERTKGKRIGHVRSLSWVADQIADSDDSESEESALLSDQTQ